MLGPISTVTIATEDVAALTAVYERWLGYRCVAREPVPAALAASWGAPAVAGRPSALLSPAGADDSFLRFVESRRAPGYRAFHHFGWNAAEHIVQDCDAVAASLAGSPFEMIGPPADLSFSDQIRALQVRGPADEVLYLTQIKSKLPMFDTPIARAPVDRVFIVILGGRTMDDIQDWYHARLAVPRAPVMAARISVLANARGAPEDTLYDIAAVPLAGQAFIEADVMPAGTLERTALPGELPPGIALVSFEVDELPDGLAWLGEPATVAARPYGGRRSATCLGPAGERVELIVARR